jgi:glutathione S-transferase
MSRYKLVSFELCPFVQRSVITLNEKRVGFDIKYIDLSNKPEWFLAISPLGKVPVLVVDDDTVLFESAVINEYLDEVTEGRMLPEDPLERAYGRAWIEFSSNLLMGAYRMQTAKDAAGVKEHASKVRDLLAKLEQKLPDDGPFFYGKELSLVDSSAAPALQRLTWCEELDPDLGLFRGFDKVTRWRDALLARESVKKSTVPDIVERFHAYLKRGEAWLARAT